MTEYEARWGLAVVTAAATEPITVAQAKTQVRQDDDADDTYFDALIATARAHVENYIGKRLITQTWDMKRDYFPVGDIPIIMPYGPVTSITSITYVDTGGTTQTLSSSLYTLDTTSFSQRLYPVYGQIWPATRDQRNAVIIRHITGYADADSVPPTIVHAVKMLVSHWYEQREVVVVGASVNELPMSIKTLLDAERASWL
jgi:uncharacterized phiE125 gp8 family phage protein